VNDALTPITNYLPHELVGQDWWPGLLAGDLGLQATVIGKRLQVGDVFCYDFAMATQKGCQVVVELNAANRYARAASGPPARNPLTHPASRLPT
jgi:hypothetical protein